MRFLCEFMSACLLIKAAGKPAVTKGTFPSYLFQYIPSISARYSGLKKPNSSRFTFLLLSVSPLSLFLNCLGKDYLDRMLPLDENFKYSANTVECHVEHIWKQFVCEAELVCPQSCFLLKCLRAHCPHFLQLAFQSRQMLAPVTSHSPTPCPPAKMADPSTEAQQAAVGGDPLLLRFGGRQKARREPAALLGEPSSKHSPGLRTPQGK